MLQLIKFPLRVTHLARLRFKSLLKPQFGWMSVSRDLANKCGIIMITISKVRVMAQNGHVSTSSPVPGSQSRDLEITGVNYT